MSSATRVSSRVPVMGLVLGLVLLLGVVAFGVLLPEVTGEESGDETGLQRTSDTAATADLALPDELPGGLVAIDTDQLDPQLIAALGGAEVIEQQQEYGAEQLSELSDGVPTNVRVYARQDGSALVQVVATAGPPGSFAPQGAPSDPQLQGFSRGSVELVASGDAVCSIVWGQAVPEGTPIDPAAKPQGVDCQAGDAEHTYRVGGGGLTVDEAVAALDSLLGA